MDNNNEKNSQKKFGTKDILIIVAIIVLLAVMILLLVKSCQKIIVPIETPDLTIDGVGYKRKDITTVLISGVNHFGTFGDNEEITDADFTVLIVLDNKAKSFEVLYLNGDTEVKVEKLDVNGNSTGEYKYDRLGSVYSYGLGRTSVINVSKSVSNLLHNMPIDFYVGITMDTVAIMNDFIGDKQGGIPVSMSYDYNLKTGTYSKGQTYVLDGIHALELICYIEDNDNVERMHRSVDYMTSFYKALVERDLSRNEIDALYKKLLTEMPENGYILTNSTQSLFEDIVLEVSHEKASEIIRFDGEYEGANFKVDDAKIIEFLTTFCYEKMN